MKLVTCFWQLCLKKGARAEAGKQKHHAKVGRKKEQQQKRRPNAQERTSRVPKHKQANKQTHGKKLAKNELLPQRVCCPWLCAMPVQHLQAPEQAREDTAPRKIDVTSNPPVGGISVVTLIRTDTTLDHSQKAEKV